MPHTLETQPQTTAGEVWVSSLAGKPAPRELLIDVSRMESFQSASHLHAILSEAEQIVNNTLSSGDRSSGDRSSGDQRSGGQR
jgi:hypothetical protein